MQGTPNHVSFPRRSTTLFNPWPSSRDVALNVLPHGIRSSHLIHVHFDSTSHLHPDRCVIQPYSTPRFPSVNSINTIDTSKPSQVNPLESRAQNHSLTRRPILSLWGLLPLFKPKTDRKHFTMNAPPRMLLLDGGANGGEACVTMPTSYEVSALSSTLTSHLPSPSPLPSLFNLNVRGQVAPFHYCVSHPTHCPILVAISPSHYQSTVAKTLTLTKRRKPSKQPWKSLTYPKTHILSG